MNPATGSVTVRQRALAASPPSSFVEKERSSGSPADATTSLMLYGVKQGLEFFNIGFASAIGNLAILCIALMCAVFTLLIRRADVRANER